MNGCMLLRSQNLDEVYSSLRLLNLCSPEHHIKFLPLCEFTEGTAVVVMEPLGF